MKFVFAVLLYIYIRDLTTESKMAELLNRNSIIESTDDLDLIISKLFSDVTTVVRRVSDVESNITNMIDDMIQQATLPLALRKRLMYQRALSG